MIENGLRLAAGAAHYAFSRPLASILLLIFAGASIHAGGNFMAQEKAHPAPLFAGIDSQKPRHTSQPSERDIDSMINALAARQATGQIGATSSKDKASDAPSRHLAIQTELARIGMYNGAVDGVIGSRTEAAIRDYEQRVGLPITGKATPGLLQRLQREPRAEKPALAPTRADATTIAAVQKRLAEMAYYQGRLNGVMSQETRTALEKFQRDRAIKVSGDIDSALLRELAKVGGPLR